MSSNAQRTLADVELDLSDALRCKTGGMLEIGRLLNEAKDLVEHGQWLSWLRRYPAACLRVVTQDVDAASIAVQHRWTLKSLPMPTAEEVAHVEQSAKQAIAAIRDANMARNVVPLRAAAQPAMAEVKRGPVLVTPEDEP